MTELMDNENILLAPLVQFSKMTGHPLPEVEKLDPQEIPEPAQKLLVHETDMTSTLTEHFGDEIILQISRRIRVEDLYARQVVLQTRDSQKPVEYGAIQIHLNSLSLEVQQEIVNGVNPLGGILNYHSVNYISNPAAYIRVRANKTMQRAFEFEAAVWLYGRCNQLSNVEGETIAEVVEILPPLEQL